MKKESIFIFLLVFIASFEYLPSAIGGSKDSSHSRNTVDLKGFCGKSSLAACKADDDCQVGGCSGQVCAKEKVITTCEYLDCYNAKKFQVQCGCVAGHCQWFRQ